MTDVFLKDEGDFFTIGFQTDKAKDVINSDYELSEALYGDDLPKVDIANESKPMIISWCVSHDLSWVEF